MKQQIKVSIVHSMVRILWIDWYMLKPHCLNSMFTVMSIMKLNANMLPKLFMAFLVRYLLKVYSMKCVSQILGLLHNKVKEKGSQTCTSVPWKKD